jgi:hypothetical protein
MEDAVGALVVEYRPPAIADYGNLRHMTAMVNELGLPFGGFAQASGFMSAVPIGMDLDFGGGGDADGNDGNGNNGQGNGSGSNGLGAGDVGAVLPGTESGGEPGGILGDEAGGSNGSGSGVAGVESSGTSGGDPSGTRELPFTGFPAAVIAAVGGGLSAAGVAIRRRMTRRHD